MIVFPEWVVKIIKVFALIVTFPLLIFRNKKNR